MTENGARHVGYELNPLIRPICISPNFKVDTKEARACLPESYARADVVFNIQRACVLLGALCQVGEPEAEVIRDGMSDRMHQVYRQHLIPGMERVFSLSGRVDGLLGIAVSGAGPSLVAFVRSGKEAKVGSEIVAFWQEAVPGAKFDVFS